LRESHGMRSDRTNIVECRSRAADEVMFDGMDNFRDDAEITFEEEIVNADDRAGERIFHGGKQRVSSAVPDRAEGGIKRRTGYGGNSAAEKLNGRGFAKGAGLTLEGHAYSSASR